MSDAHTAGTRELLQVLEGAIRVEAEGATFELETGDAVTFSGETDHTYENPHAAAARFTLAVFEPGVGRVHEAGPSHD